MRGFQPAEQDTAASELIDFRRPRPSSGLSRPGEVIMNGGGGPATATRTDDMHTWTTSFAKIGTKAGGQAANGSGGSASDVRPGAILVETMKDEDVAA
jgi:hypothetical protein